MNTYYYLNAQAVPQGPHTLDELAELMASGRVNPTTLVACKGGTSWEPLGSVLSRENVEAPAITPEPGQVGNCPSCGHDLGTELQEGRLPVRCPSCGRALRPLTGGIWANFCLALRNYFKFSGRATRAEYWSFQLFNFLVTMGLYIIMIAVPVAGVISGSAEALAEVNGELTEDKISEAIITAMDQGEMAIGLTMFLCAIGILLWCLFMFIPNLSATVRRLHDVGWSGWWLVLYAMLSVILPAMVMLLEVVAGGGEGAEPGIAHIAIALAWMASYGFAIFLLVLMLLDSKRGANKYGPSSKYPLG